MLPDALQFVTDRQTGSVLCGRTGHILSTAPMFTARNKSYVLWSWNRSFGVGILALSMHRSKSDELDVKVDGTFLTLSGLPANEATPFQLTFLKKLRIWCWLQASMMTKEVTSSCTKLLWWTWTVQNFLHRVSADLLKLIIQSQKKRKKVQPCSQGTAVLERQL